MDMAELEQLVALVRQSQISELTLKQDGARLTIRKSPEPSMGTALVPVSGAYDAQIESEGIVLDGESVPQDTMTTVIAPLVGVYHHVKPVVGLAAQVQAGQIIGIINAMGLDNEVTASIDGVVNDVLVEDGMPVEYGQPLFLVEPAG